MSEMTWMFFGAFLSFRGIYTEQVVIRDQQRAYRMKAEHMRQLFYTPEYAKTGDVIPFYNEKTKRFENYYLKNWNPDAPKDLAFHGWYRIVTEDLRTYVETPTKIQGGTGSVICVDGLYHMFYCTFDRDPAAQWARHATSVDLVHWKDIPEEKFGPDGTIYRMSDWRDPFVFWNEEDSCWWMLLAARENGKTERNGCVALCKSKDLSHWTYQKPLYSPHMHQGAYECPDLFCMGDWYYLVFSSYTDGFATYYRMSRSLSGPWIRPERDTFDGRAFYAAKTGTDGKNRYIFGWNPTRGENGWGFDPGTDFGADYKSWNWGGSIVTHQLVQHEDGSLGTRPVESVAEAFTAKKTDSFTPLTGQWTMEAGKASCDAQEGYSAAIGSLQIPEQCCIRASIRYEGTPRSFGLALQVDERFDFGYYLMFEPDFSRIEFRSGLRMYEQGGQMFPYAVEMERAFRMTPGKTYQLELYIQGSLAVLYIDRDVAFGFRMYNWKNRKLGLFAADGGICVKDCEILTEEEK